MTVAAGVRLGPYEVLSPIGKGGMGEVWRARDARLGREVAVKVLPVEVARDPERLRRFETEARAVSALSHPGILTIHDVGDVDGVAYFVTELLEGEPLNVVLARGALAVPRALGMALQIARALAAAHAKGVVHRDLKPANLFVGRGDVVKVLDFGLARIASPSGALPDADAVSTRSGMTAPGSVLGTAGYMAPEQVRGEPADARSDLFALGCVLYEMLTGSRAFRRPTVVETLSATLAEEPPALRPLREAPGLDVVVRHCLEKEPAERFQSAHDLAFALEALRAPGATTPPEGEKPARRRLSLVAALGAALLVGAGGLAGVVLSRRSPGGSPAPGPGRLEHLTTDPGYEGEPTLSPDGGSVAYVADREGNFEIYLQQVAGGPAINLTRNAASDVQPSLSPDGRLVAFVSDRSSRSSVHVAAPGSPLVGGDIWVMPALGGPARRVAEEGNFPSWSPDGGQLVFTRGPLRASRLAVVPATGGSPTELKVDREGDARLSWPSFSADGRWILLQDGGMVAVVPAAGGTVRPLAPGEHPAWGAGSASILFTAGGPGSSRTLWQAPFSSRTGALSAPPRSLTFGSGAEADPAISRDGRTIVFVALDETRNVEEAPIDAEEGRLLGAPRAVTSGSNLVGFFDPSPDGSAVVFDANRGTGRRLWRVEPPAPPVQLTSDRKLADGSARWSPNGAEIAFERGPSEQPFVASELWVMRSDGTAPRKLSTSSGPSSWLADGRRLLAPRGAEVVEVDVGTGSERVLHGVKIRTYFAVDDAGEWIAANSAHGGDLDIDVVRTSGGEPRTVVSTPRNDLHPFFSPKGRWLYFQVDHKNVWRVPGPAQAWKASPPVKVTNFPEAGLYLEDPHLSRDGRHLFYARGRTTGDLWVLRLDTGPAGSP